MTGEIRQIDFSNPETANAWARLLLQEVEYANNEKKIITPELIAQHLKDTADGYNIGVFNGDTLVAGASVDQTGKKPRTSSYIDYVAVSPDRRREGLGSMMLRHIAKEALKRGDKSIRLISLADHFFFNAGFVDSEQGVIAEPSVVVARPTSPRDQI